MANAKKRKRGKRKPVPSEEKFMPDVSTDDIKAVLKTEQKSDGNAKAVLILLACSWRRDGEDGTYIARCLNQSVSTVYAWLSRMHQGGLGARYDKPRLGRPRIIDPTRHKEISDIVDRQPEACGMKSNVWTGRLLLIMIINVLGINNISRRAVYRTMHRMNKSHRKPGRPFDYRTPSDEDKEKFKTDLSKDIAKAVADGFRVLWIDEAHFTIKTKLGLTWLAKGLSIVHKIKPFEKKCTCFAAWGADGMFFHRYYDRGNTDNMIDFVQNLYEEFNKVLLIMDNASYHKSKNLIKDLEKYGNSIRIIYLPVYSPDLNPVEMVWKELKKYIANGMYRRVNDMTRVMDDMLYDGTVIMPNLPQYALDIIRHRQAAAA